MTEDVMVVWDYRLDGHEFEQAPGVGDGQGSLAASVCGVTKCWCFSFSISPSNEYSDLISFRPVGSPCTPRASQESSPIPQFRSINSSMFSFL